MDAQQAFNELQQRLRRLLSLNPDLGVADLQDLHALADAADGRRFGELAAFAEELIQHYLASPQKRIATEVLREYFAALDQSARLLAARDQISRDARQATPAEQSVAMVPRQLYTPLEWCRVLDALEMPRETIRAVEACRRRNELVETVLECLFGVMLRVDAEKAWSWQLAFLEAHRGDLDADVVRDILNAWHTRPTVPRPALAWAEAWSADQNLLQQWPHVVRRADRLLCRHALEAWSRETTARGPALARLQILIRDRRTDDRTLLAWLKSALADIGEAILRFVSLSRSVSAEGAEAHPWRSGAIVREILRIEGLFTPVLLIADRILDVPEGPYTFAVAFFGLVGRGRDQWEGKLLRLAEDAVRRAFLQGLRDGIPPQQTITTLTFGNREAREWALNELDAATLQFDSLRQRERVVRFLAVFYASFREHDLLGGEILRRYRSLMRLMHEDHLRRCLEPEHFAEVMQRSILRDLAAVAAEARRYLARRRALQSSLPELVAADIEFTQGIRRRRQHRIHRLLESPPPAPPTAATPPDATPAPPSPARRRSAGSRPPASARGRGRSRKG